MLPHTRIRAPRELSENVPVRSNEPLLRHASPAAALRRRIGRRSSTLFSVACGTLIAVCVIAVYLLAVSADSPPVRRVSGAANDTAPTPVKTLVTEVPTAAVPAATTTTTTTPPTAEPTATPLTPSTQIPTPDTPMAYINIFDREDTRTARPVPVFDDIMEQYEAGEYEPEEPDRLPGLTVTRRTYTPEELMSLHANTDFIYSFVNGSEVTHHYRKATVGSCQDRFRELERTVYASGGAIPSAMLPELNNNTPVCSPNYLQKRIKEIRSVSEMVNALTTHIRPGIGDRETDELRHSIRSVEQHVGWHRGRVVIVSPGHHPTWVDGAKNFLAGVCGDATVQALRLRGTHLRLTTVHQDAIMPYGIRLTVDSHSIEQHIWRVRNTTAVHVYMNDDYFVNRDVAITDLFNEYGGTIVRTEKGILKDGIRAAEGTGTWGEGVRNTHMFNVIELDMRHDDYLPDNLEAKWLAEKKEKQLPLAAPIPPIAIDEIIDAAHMYGPTEWPRRVKPRRHRRYATHAPFVYCTNMHRYMQTRYALDFAHNSYNHRGRKARDLYVPFVYNAFIMARPWVASPQFLPYLLQLRRSRTESPTEVAPVLNIPLDNFNSCGPATLRGGRTASHCLYGKFVDNVTANDDLAERIRVANPLYFNINAGFSTEGASNQLRQYLHNRFPTPAYLEAPATTTAEEAGEGDEEDHTTVAADTAAADAVLQSLFGQLMALPVVGLVSYEEGVCPLVRSLPLAFAGHHRGRVHVAVQRHGDGESDESLRETRVRLGHRVVSAMPALRCAYDSRVSVGASARGESVSDAAARVLVDGDGAGVELPATCGGGLAGLRVRGFVVDARTPGAPVASAAALPTALAMPGQTLALEDFRAVRVGPEDGDVVLVLAREDAAAKAVHWIGGASENDLLVTYPLPVEAYEDMSAPLRWTSP